jgi:hypothetical protein
MSPPITPTSSKKTNLGVDNSLLRSNSAGSATSSYASSSESSQPGSSSLAASTSSSDAPPFDMALTPNRPPPLPLDEPPRETSPQVVNFNYYVDKDLLRGVCKLLSSVEQLLSLTVVRLALGFMAPTISAQLLPMQGVMPNIISLPYGRCPPLHLQAPNWRHLLKLMAWLSGTRIEPTVEAMAITKSDALALRTVIQFVKVSWYLRLLFKD